MTARRSLLSAASGVLGGFVLVALVLAILTAAVAASRASSTAAELSQQLHDANSQLDALRADNARAAAHAQKASRERVKLQQQVAGLAQFLREHGYAVPRTGRATPTPVSPPASPPAPRYVAPEPTHPRPHRATPHPTRHATPKPSPTHRPRPTAPPPSVTPPPCVLTLCLG